MRYALNKQVPVYLYGRVEFKTLGLTYYTSKAGTAEIFANVFSKMKHAMLTKENEKVEKKANDNTITPQSISFDYIPSSSNISDVDLSHLDPMFADVARLIVSNQSGSTSLIQRKLSIGYNRACRLIEQLEAAGIVGPAKGSKPRLVLIDGEVALENKLQELKNSTKNTLEQIFQYPALQDEKEKKLQEKLRFAGEKIPSMKRRSNVNDYYGRHIYMVTMAVEGRRPLLGTLTGSSTVADGQPGAPCVVPTPLGQEVIRCWELIPQFHQEVRLLAFQLMPDHLHGILFVQETMEEHLGQVISGFKAGCNKAYRRLVEAVPQHTGEVEPQLTNKLPLPSEHRLKKEDRSHGLLFERGYNDLISKSYDMLPRLTNYLHDNPRRLAIRREHPDYFRVQFGVTVAGQTYAAIGNRFLLNSPDMAQVQLTRKLTEAQIAKERDKFLNMAKSGTVLVSPAISDGERIVMRTVMNARLSQVFITPWGFNKFSKPGHQYFDACAEGRLLLLAPWPHQNERIPLTRAMCLALNKMAEDIVNSAKTR